jgi:hypothetical protein
VGEATDGDADHAHTGEALVAVRRYRRKRTSGGAPLSVTVVPNNPLAAQAAEWSTALSMANARAGLEKLAAGHSQWFIEEFAPSMLRQADTPDETAYWQSLIDATREHIEDDKLAAEVAAGTKQFEDVAEQLRRRMAAAGKESPEYPDLLEKLNQVTDAIAARDFNREIYAAQEKLSKDHDRAAYLATLEGLQTRARAPQAQMAIASQVADLQKEIEDEKAALRMSSVNEKVIGYLEGTISRGEVINFLRGEAASGRFSPTESAYLVNVAQEIDTRERTIERQNASSAAGSSTKALQDVIDPAKHSYEMADAEFKAAFRAGRADRDIYDSFVKEAAHYLDVLKDALPNAATRTVREQILNQLESITANKGERQLQMAELIKRDVTADVDDLNSKADRAAAKNTPEGDDLAAQMRYLATEALQTALADPVIMAQGESDESVRALTRALRETTEKHQSTIESQAEIVSGTGGPMPLRKANRDAFNAYEDYMLRASAPDALIEKGVPLGYEQFLDTLEEFADDPVRLAGALGISVKPAEAGTKAKEAAAKAMLDVGNLVIGWQTNIGQAERAQKDLVDAASLRLRALVAPRSVATGRRVEEGAISEPTDVTDFLSTFGRVPFMHAAQASSIAPQEQNTYAGAGLIDQLATPSMGRPPGLSAPLESEDEMASEDPYDRAERLAWEYLEKPTYELSLSSWDVPPLPVAPEFVPSLDLGSDRVSDMPLDTHERTLRSISPTPLLGGAGPADGTSPTIAA